METIPVITNDEVQIGDLMWHDGELAHPASKATTEAQFNESFVGVAAVDNPEGVKNMITVLLTGIVEYTCSVPNLPFGHPVRAFEFGGVLMDQVVEPCDDLDEAIGQVIMGLEHTAFVRVKSHILDL